jgi:hypothetical protein
MATPLLLDFGFSLVQPFPSKGGSFADFHKDPTSVSSAALMISQLAPKLAMASNAAAQREFRSPKSTVN